MWILALLPFALQMVLILFDEVYFHYKRVIPRWERIGHPLDTFSLLICFLIVLFLPLNEEMIILYGACSILSCLMVTKDEFIHKHYSPAAENWLHALLFILHPIILLNLFAIWFVIGNEAPLWISNWLNNPPMLYMAVVIQAASIFTFGMYQIIYWNFIRAYD